MKTRAPVCKICRREDTKLFLKGQRCVTAKCAMDKGRPAPSGNSRYSSPNSTYRLQLREKEKVRSFYGVLERQFRRYFAMAQKSGQAPGEKLLIFLERRLDNALVVAGLLPSRRSARQLIGSGHIRVNGRRMSIPSYLVDNGDEVDLRSASRVLPKLKEMILAGGVVKQCPAWLNLDKEAVKIKILREPSRSEISVSVEEGHIVNLYSR